MANFTPLNNYTLYLLDKIIVKYELEQPFLDAGCGTGYVSRYLAMKGWQGKAIDMSEEVLRICRKKLFSFDSVRISKESILDQKGKFNTVILFDVIEHMKDDEKVLRKINSLLTPNGYMIMALTSNPKEWRWDDEFYGHYRRYSEKDVRSKLIRVGFKPSEFIEYTFPVFWFIRILYTTVLRPPKVDLNNKMKRTSMSAVSSAWRMPSLFSAMIKFDALWKIIFIFQYLFFRKFTSHGFAMIVVAKKGK